jgi:hypothetical protein
LVTQRLPAEIVRSESTAEYGLFLGFRFAGVIVLFTQGVPDPFVLIQVLKNVFVPVYLEISRLPRLRILVVVKSRHGISNAQEAFRAQLLWNQR